MELKDNTKRDPIQSNEVMDSPELVVSSGQPQRRNPNITMWVALAAALVLIAGGIFWYLQTNKTKPIVKQTYKVGFMALDEAVPGTSAAMKHGLSMAQQAFDSEAVGVTIVTKETSCDGEAAAQAMKEFAEEGVVAVVGELCSDATLAAAPVANEKRIPIISPASTSPKLSTAGDYVYRVIPSDALSTEYAADLMYGDYNVRKLAVLHTDDSFGNDTALGLKTAIEKLGGSLAIDKTYDVEQTDVTNELKAIKDSGADGLFIAGVGTNDTVLLKKHELGITIPTFGAEYFKDETLLQSAGDAAEGLFIIAPSDGTKTFAEKYQVIHKETPPSYAAQSYDALTAIIKGLQQGATTGQTLKRKLDSVSFDGVTGRIVFDKNGDVAGNYQVFVVKDGKPSLVK